MATARGKGIEAHSARAKAYYMVAYMYKDIKVANIVQPASVRSRTVGLRFNIHSGGFEFMRL